MTPDLAELLGGELTPREAAMAFGVGHGMNTSSVEVLRVRGVPYERAVIMARTALATALVCHLCAEAKGEERLALLAATTKAITDAVQAITEGERDAQ